MASKISRAFNDVGAALRMYDIWGYLAYDEVLTRYRRTLLGPFWNVMFFLGQALALSLVFGGIFGLKLAEVLPYIMTGLVAWALVPGSIFESASLLTMNAPTIKTQPFPFTFYALRYMSRTFVLFLHNLVAILVVLALLHKLVLFHWTIIPAIITGMLILAPAALLLGMICARFRDMQLFMQNFTPVFFFLTPVFWRADKVTGARRLFIDYNPLSYVVDMIRNPLLGMPPSQMDWIVCLGLAGAMIVLAIAALTLFRARIAHWV